MMKVGSKQKEKEKAKRVEKCLDKTLVGVQWVVARWQYGGQ